MDDINTFAFDWQALPEQDFLQFLLVSFSMADKTQDEQREWVEAMSERTDKFTNVQMDIQINGIPVPASALIRELRRHLTWIAEQAARELVSNVGFGELEDELREAEKAIRDVIHDRLRKAGIEIPERDDDW